jgi:hypothetical protein
MQPAAGPPEGSTGDDARDPHGLLASGEPLATASELAAILGVSGKALRELLGGLLYPRPDALGPVVRFVRGSPGPLRYSVADARTAIEPHRGAIEERRRRAAEQQAQHAAKQARLAASSAAPSTRGATRKAPATPPARTRTTTPRSAPS